MASEREITQRTVTGLWICVLGIVATFWIGVALVVFLVIL